MTEPLFTPEAAYALTLGLGQAQLIVKEVNESHGWFDADRSFGDDIALLHSELSEWLESYRDGDEDEVQPNGKPVGPSSEAADVLVRLLDTCERYSIDLPAAFMQKVEFNNTRPHRHGNKKL